MMTYDIQYILPLSIYMEEIVLINEHKASERYGMSVAWFQRKRWAGDGPPYQKIGSAVRYSVKELDSYFCSKDKKRTNTSDEQHLHRKN